MKTRIVTMRNVEYDIESFYKEEEAKILIEKKSSRYLITSHPVTVEFDILSKVDLVNNEIAMLRRVKEGILAYSQHEANQVENKIQKLLAIEGSK